MSLDKTPEPTLTCFHDGDCPICRVEINAMKQLDQQQQNVKWVDISTDKAALMHYGLSYEQAMSQMHVLDNQGFKSGVDGFLLLWSQLPYYRRLVPIVEQVPLLKSVLSVAYRLFARYRLTLTGKV